MNFFKVVPGFLCLLGTPILSGTSEWLLQDCILHLHLYSNFKMYGPLTLGFFYFDLSLFTQNAVKFLYFKFYVLRERSRDIASFLEHSVYSKYLECLNV